MTLGRRPIRCRCGRETNRPQLVNGLLLCERCGFDEEYGAYSSKQPQRTARDYTEPRFRVRRIA